MVGKSSEELNGKLEEWKGKSLNDKDLSISWGETECIESDFGERKHVTNRER